MCNAEPKHFRLQLVETQGKQNKDVPILLTEEVTDALEVLNTTRSKCGIKEENPYVFANAEKGSPDTWQVLQRIAKSAGCKQPQPYFIKQAMDVSSNSLSGISC